MASIHQKTKGGVWYVTYRENGKLKHRSLKTKNEREARQLNARSGGDASAMRRGRNSGHRQAAHGVRIPVKAISYSEGIGSVVPTESDRVFRWK